MAIQFVLLPLFVEVLLTLGLLIWLFLLRRNDLMGGKVHPRQIALREPNWPARTLQVGNCLANQFELPALFYVLTILEIITRHADLVFVVLAWIFVLSRVVHAYIHTTSNRVMRRGTVYGVGVLALITMWIVFMVRILLELP
ncbi:MAG: MAPEG family protein [Pseudolabrys sp.]